MYIDLSREHKYLLAMSGGLDSCVLFYLLIKNKIDFSVAHANFKLRDKESDLDEKFVRILCEKHHIKFYTKSLDVKYFKENHNASTQIAARVLRYEWFDVLMKTSDFDYLLTAHHADDSMETFFINLLRGTGLNGLLGIKNQNKIIRPLLLFSKKEIYDFAKNHQIKWREDKSNASDVYIRNAIRHHIIPKLNEINPNFNQSFLKTIENLNNDYDLLNDYINHIKNKVSKTINDVTFFDIEKLKKPKIQKTIFHLFSPYGFNHTQEILKIINSKNNSAEILSDDYRLIKDRNQLILSPLKNQKNCFKIEDLNTKDLPINFKLFIKNNIDCDSEVLFDANKIKFPLYLRLYKMGDIFYPKGMKGKSKKVSKFFKDLKLSKIEKENTWLLCDANNQILWIVNHRQDERFLPNNKTTKWLIAES